MGQLVRQHKGEVPIAGEGMCPATAQKLLSGNAGLSAYGNDNGFDRYSRGDISEIFVPRYKASTSFFLRR